MKTVILITDGACVPNPGPGGWAAILRYGEHAREFSGSERFTTNNRMEMRAIIEGLIALKEPCRVTVRTDSKLAIVLAEKTGPKWVSGQWRKKKAPKNTDLLEALMNAMQRHQVTFEWVRGHSGDADNERCDYLATQMATTPF